ncbi:hypothetical protein Tco_0778584, partial [Tanacetum coccineum]
GHYRKDCPKIKNQNRGNKASVPDAKGRAYALGGGDVNPGSNTITASLLGLKDFKMILRVTTAQGSKREQEHRTYKEECDSRNNRDKSFGGPDELDVTGGNLQQDLKDKGVINSGCSRHITGNKSYLTDYEEIDGGFVAFRGNSKGGKITGKGKIRTGKLDFEDVYFVKELKFNLFSVSQMYDKKNSVLFTDTECVVLSPDFKLTDESHVFLKVPRKDNMYSVDLKNVVP